MKADSDIDFLQASDQFSQGEITPLVIGPWVQSTVPAIKMVCFVENNKMIKTQNAAGFCF